MTERGGSCACPASSARSFSRMTIAYRRGAGTIHPPSSLRFHPRRVFPAPAAFRGARQPDLLHSPGLGHDSVDIYHAGFDVLHVLLDARLPPRRGLGPFFRRNARIDRIADPQPAAPAGRCAALSGAARGARRRVRRCIGRTGGGDPAGPALTSRSRNRVDPVICRRPAADLWLVAGMVRSGEGRCCSISPPRRRRAKTR